MAYCIETDIEALIQADITASTKPTSLQVSTYIDMYSAEVDVALMVANISLPVSDASFLLFLKKKVSVGVAGLILMTYSKDFESVNTGLANMFYQDFKDFMKDLLDNPEKYAAMISSSVGYHVSNNIDAGITEQPDLLGDTIEW